MSLSLPPHHFTGHVSVCMCASVRLCECMNACVCQAVRVCTRVNMSGSASVHVCIHMYPCTERYLNCSSIVFRYYFISYFTFFLSTLEPVYICNECHEIQNMSILSLWRYQLLQLVDNIFHCPFQRNCEHF